MATRTYTDTGTILGKTFRMTTTVDDTDTTWEIKSVKLEFAKSISFTALGVSCHVDGDHVISLVKVNTAKEAGFTVSGSYYTRTVTDFTCKVTKTHTTQTGHTTYFSLSFWVEGKTGRAASENLFHSFTVPVRTSYNVSYNANGGSGAPSAQTKWHSETLTLSTTKPTRTGGYVFWHWNTASNNSGTSYGSGGNYTANAAATLYAIWNPIITYNANGSGVGGMPVSQTKTYGSAMALSSNVPTRAGYAFDGWYTNTSGTGTKYSPGQTIAAGSNAPLTLYAKWLKVPSPPKISSMSVVRCDSSGNEDDEGTYGKVTVGWSVDTTSDTVTDNTGTVTGTIKADGSSTTRTLTFSSGASGTSGTAVAIVADCDTDTQYLVTVTVTDKAASTTRTDLLTRAKFVLDFRAAGNAMGIGSAAPQSGLEVGWDAQFDEDVTVLGDITAANLTPQELTAISDVISASGTWSVTGAAVRRWGHLCFVYLNVKNSTALAAGSSATVIGTIAQGFRPKSPATFGCNKGGGWVNTGGSLYFAPFAAVSANTTFYLSLTYFV